MPLELIEIEHGRRVLSPGDRGFLISLAKLRWNRNSAQEIIKLLKSYAQPFYEEKFPECKVPIKEEAGDSTDKELQKSKGGEQGNNINIQFVQRELMYNNCGFIACNLAEPAEFAHYVLTKLSELKSESKIKFPFRIMPVEEVCEAKPKAVEKAVLPLIEKTLGVGNQPLRFSLMYRGNNEVESLTQQEAIAVVRNCVWAVNPNCVQCIKYQDYAVVMHMLSPLFLIGICKDFQRLACYNTWTIKQGLDLTDLGEDSEDDISDDPDLDEDEEKKRKLRIKRKRRAEKAGLLQTEDDMKKSFEMMEADDGVQDGLLEMDRNVSSNSGDDEYCDESVEETILQ